MGKDVVILMDSITRLARAFNKWVGNTGRTMSGGVDIKAMDIPKKLFATARLFEEGGSLTIVGTALIDTGSRMDEVDLPGVQGHRQHGTGARPQAGRPPRLAGHRHQPVRRAARKSSCPPDQLKKMYVLRRILNPMGTMDAIDFLLDKLRNTKNNSEFFNSMNT